MIEGWDDFVGEVSVGPASGAGGRAGRVSLAKGTETEKTTSLPVPDSGAGPAADGHLSSQPSIPATRRSRRRSGAVTVPLPAEPGLEYLNAPPRADGGGSRAVAVIPRRMIQWDANGMPVPATVPMVSKEGVSELARTVMSLPFEPARGLDGEVSEEERGYVEQGLTNIEVTLLRMAKAAASGDLSTANVLLDRILGKPKQSVESKSLTLTYEDWLKAQAAKEEHGDTI